MKSHRLLLAAILMGFSAAPEFSSVEAANTNLSREEIRQMPITQRPSRPGHFYGNAVRRSTNRRSGH